MSNDNGLPLPTISLSPDGLISHVYYRHDENGRTFRVQQTIDTSFDHQKSIIAACERQNKWVLYGRAADPAKRVQPSLDEQAFRLVTNPDLLEISDIVLSEAQSSQPTGTGTVKCRICKGLHWTRECPNKDMLDGQKDSGRDDKSGLTGVSGLSGASGSTDGLGGAGGSAAEIYVPPFLRGKGAGGIGEPTPSDPRRGDDAPSVRISNLPMDMTDEDLHNLASRHGTVMRSFLARYEDNNCKGYAFVNYSRLDHAEKAVRHINGYPFKSMILACEHSKRRERP